MNHIRNIANKRIDMNLFIALCGIFWVALTLAACNGDSSNSYSISIEHLPFEQIEPESEESIDYSSATVSIKRVDISETNEEVLSELMSSPFHNGKVQLRGQIEQPMWVEVLVDSHASNKTLSTRTFVEPSEHISLAVVEAQSLHIPDTIAHVGSLSNVQDPSKKFTLVGDISSSNVDFRHAIAYLESVFWSEQGEYDWELSSFVVIQDGKFTLEIEIEEPVILSLYVSGVPQYSSWARFVAERGTTIRFQHSKQSVQTSASLSTGWFQARRDASQNPQNQSTVEISGSERHARLFDRWQKSFTYRLVEKQYFHAVEELNALRAELETMRPIDEETNELQHADNVASRTIDSRVQTDPAEGCEHINISQVRPDHQDRAIDIRRSRLQELSNERYSIQRSVLNDIARRARDPFDSLLALELERFQFSHEKLEAIKLFDDVSQLVSQDIVDKRITPARNYLSSVIESQKQEHRTIPGQKVPDFELPDIHGNSQRFNNILKENDLVFMSFVPRGKHYFKSDRVASLHDRYSEAGLQIVEVLFNVDSDKQRELALNQDIAWIQLVDPNIHTESEIARSYAIVHRYIEYLVDSNGCIVQWNLDTEDLRDYLNSYFDIPAGTK